MQWIRTLFLAIVFFSLTVLPGLNASSARAGDEQRNFYTQAVEDIIAKCEGKIHLEDSRSPHLCQYAEDAGRKARFVTNNKDRLIQAMMAAELPLKTYKIEKFLNAQYDQQIEARYAKQIDSTP